MATYHHHGPNGGGFPANPPKFFKVITDPDSDNLRIPPEFVRKHGHDLPGKVFLKVPSGNNLWKVELINSDGEICFKKGWEDFKERYSVKFGYFLVFVYDGDSKLDVFIFDMTCTEIDYPSSSDDGDDDDDDSDEEAGSESDDGVVFLGEISNSQKSRGKRLAVVPHQEQGIITRKRPKTDFSVEKSADFPVRRTSTMVKLVGDDIENSDEEDSFSKDQEGGSSRIDIGRKFTKQLMLYHAYRLKLPKEFTKGTCISANMKIIVKDVKGREWQVNIAGGTSGIYDLCGGWNEFLKNNNIIVGSTMLFKFVSSSCNIIEARVVKRGPNKKELFSDVKNKGGKLKIIASHDQTRRPAKVPIKVESDNNNRSKEQENGFHVGSKRKFSKKMKNHQACKLDFPKERTMIKRSKTNVSIENSADFAVGRASGRVKLDGDDTANNEDDEDSFTNQEGMSRKFTKQLMIYHAHELELPNEFTKGSGISSHRKIILQDVKGREWQVNVTRRTSGRYRLGGGWYKFLTDKKITVGSTLSFKFVSCSECIIEARVLKTGANRNELFNYVKKSRGGSWHIVASHDHARRRPGKVPVRAESENDNDRIKERENGFRVGNTWKFSRKMKKHHAYKLDIPKEFAKATGIVTKNKITLKGRCGREWPVEVTTDRKCCRYSMITGWADFLKDNEVLKGSTVSFKFVPFSDNLIQVRVLKNGTRGKPLFANRGRA